jgi:hypothetical protein
MTAEEYKVKTSDLLQHPPRPRKRKKMVEYIPSAIAVIATVAMSSLSSLFQFQFELKSVVWTSFVLTMLLRAGTFFASKFVGADARFKAELTSESMERVKTEFTKEAHGIDIVDFEKWIIERNKRAKREAILAQNAEKICLLSQKMDRLIYLNYKTDSHFRHWRIERIKRKIEEIEKVNTPEYVEKNISHIRVKFEELHAADFLVDSEKSTEGRKIYTLDETRENTIEILKGIPLMLAITLFATLLGWNYTIGEINVLTLILDIGFVAFNFSMGYGSVGRKTAASMMTMYTNRRAVVCAFKKEAGECDNEKRGANTPPEKENATEEEKTTSCEG